MKFFFPPTHHWLSLNPLLPFCVCWRIWLPKFFFPGASCIPKSSPLALLRWSPNKQPPSEWQPLHDKEVLPSLGQKVNQPQQPCCWCPSPLLSETQPVCERGKEVICPLLSSYKRGWWPLTRGQSSPAVNLNTYCEHHSALYLICLLEVNKGEKLHTVVSLLYTKLAKSNTRWGLVRDLS